MDNKSNPDFSVQTILDRMQKKGHPNPLLTLWSKLPDSLDFLSIDELKEICIKAHADFNEQTIFKSLLDAFHKEYSWESMFHDHNDVDAREFITGFLLDWDPALTYTFREMFRSNPDLTLYDVNIMSIYRTGVNLYYRPYALAQTTEFVQQNFYLFDRINDQFRIDSITNNSNNEHNT